MNPFLSVEGALYLIWVKSRFHPPVFGHFAFAEEPGIFNFDVFDNANWERLAELAGEPVDMQGAQAWVWERGTSSADASWRLLPLAVRKYSDCAAKRGVIR